MNLNLIIYIIFVPVLAIILLSLNTLLAPHKADEYKLAQYEAGMLAIPGQTRESFQIHFWLVAMLFLIFDIELVLLLPLTTTLSVISYFGYIIGMIFFIILTIGFIFEISSKAISIQSNKMNNELNIYINQY